MCKCKNVEIGSYNNQVELYCELYNKNICIDRCLEEEIKFLWKNGIKTTGCCCGHNRAEPMINVSDDNHYDMLSLGYSWWVNSFGVNCYIPKTLKNKN